MMLEDEPVWRWLYMQLLKSSWLEIILADRLMKVSSKCFDQSLDSFNRDFQLMMSMQEESLIWSRMVQRFLDDSFNVYPVRSSNRIDLSVKQLFKKDHATVGV